MSTVVCHCAVAGAHGDEIGVVAGFDSLLGFCKLCAFIEDIHTLLTHSVYFLLCACHCPVHNPVYQGSRDTGKPEKELCLSPTKDNILSSYNSTYYCFGSFFGRNYLCWI